MCFLPAYPFSPKFFVESYEFQLWQEWSPHFKHPISVGLRKSCILKAGKGCSIVQGIVDLPWPMLNRDTVLEFFTTDAIDDELSAIITKVFSHEEATVDGIVPPCEEGADRMYFDGGIVFRKCPPNHPSLLKSNNKKRSIHNNKKEEPMILMTFSAFMKPTINLIVKTFFPPTWDKLFRLAEEVRDGKRPMHDKAITDRKELYDWVTERVNALTQKLE